MRPAAGPGQTRRRCVPSANTAGLEGGYEVEPDANSAKFVLRWVGTIAPDVSLPPLFGEVVMRMSIQDQFTGMVSEIDRREALRRAKEKDVNQK